MLKSSVLIIGCSISSLYAAIKCVDLGYSVTIVDRNNNIEISDYLYNNSIIFNNNHNKYINLLKRFNIDFKDNNIILNDKIVKIIKIVQHKAKYIPNYILLSHSFKELSSQLLNKNDLRELSNYDSIFNIINAKECIDMFSNDFNTNYVFYKLNNCDVLLLINKMIDYLNKNNCEILFNININNINYINNNFKIYAEKKQKSLILYSNIILSTISKKNLLLFNFWNSDQISVLNSTYSVNILEVKKFIDYVLINNNSSELNSREIIIKNIHVVYPLFNKMKDFYLWKKNKNPIFLIEKIRNLYNKKFFICSQSYSKNSIFINYSLEDIDVSISKLQKKIILKS
jgi:hypothetical protein